MSVPNGELGACFGAVVPPLGEDFLGCGVVALAVGAGDVVVGSTFGGGVRLPPLEFWDVVLVD